MENEETKSYYAIIPANVRYDNDLIPNAKLLYAEITSLCNQKGYCWATNDYFAKLYGVSKVSISKYISLLIEKGYIKSEIEQKENSKEISRRYLKIVNDPIKENFNTPIKENLMDNNKILNNKINKKKYKKEIEIVVNYMNKLAKTTYRATTEMTIHYINARLEEGFSVSELLDVVYNQYKHWVDTNSSAYAKGFELYFRPQTLFNSAKFESYLQDYNKFKDRPKEEFEL